MWTFSLPDLLMQLCLRIGNSFTLRLPCGDFREVFFTFSVTQCLHLWCLTNMSMHCFPCKTFAKHFYYTFSISDMQLHVTFGTFVMWVLIHVSHVFYQLAASSLQLRYCIFLPRYYHLIIYQRHYSSQCPSHVVCPSRVTDRTSGLTPWAKEPVALPDMRMFVLQVSVGPDQALRGEDHLVSGLLELLQQLFRTRGKNDIVTVPIREKNGNCYCAAQWKKLTKEVAFTRFHGSSFGEWSWRG